MPQYIFLAWCLVKHRDNFTFTLPLYHRLPEVRLCTIMSLFYSAKLADSDSASQ
jgi:hypothetical protein